MQSTLAVVAEELLAAPRRLEDSKHAAVLLLLLVSRVRELAPVVRQAEVAATKDVCLLDNDTTAVLPACLATRTDGVGAGRIRECTARATAIWRQKCFVSLHVVSLPSSTKLAASFVLSHSSHSGDSLLVTGIHRPERGCPRTAGRLW